MEQNEESDSEPEFSFAEEVEKEEFETDEEEEEWNPKHDPLAKEAVLYDSSLEQSNSKGDEYSYDKSVSIRFILSFNHHLPTQRSRSLFSSSRKQDCQLNTRCCNI